MKMLKKVSVGALCALAISGNLFITNVFADAREVVTIGANLTPQQKEQMLTYFGIKDGQAEVVEVNNQEERKYLEGKIPDAQIGHQTLSCAFVQPTEGGKGINVKTANLTFVTSSMIASTLATAGVTDANVIAAAPFKVSGTGALTGVMKAFEDATGKPLSEEKKELATDELVVTGDIAKNEGVGQDKANAAVNEIKTQIIKDGTKDTNQIANTINNVTNNYNINLNDTQKQDLQKLMEGVSKQGYDYKDMKDALNNINKTLDDKLTEMGAINQGFFDKVGNWFSNLGQSITGAFNKPELGILENTNDAQLGAGAVVDSTDKEAVKVATDENGKILTGEKAEQAVKDGMGFFEKVVDWFKGLFGNSALDKLEKPEGEAPKAEEQQPANSQENENKDANAPQDGIQTNDDALKESMDKGVGGDLHKGDAETKDGANAPKDDKQNGEVTEGVDIPAPAPTN
ncbi:DUF1002 domain-containing protein [Paraclostridium bifermentans]